MSSEKKKKRRHRVLKVMGWCLLGLFLAAVLVRIVSGVIAQRRYDAAIADLLARGEPISLAQLAPSGVPDDANAAPLYLRAFQSLGGCPLDSLPRLDELTRGAGPLSDQELQEARALLTGFAAPLELLRRAATLPDCRFPLDYSRPAYDFRLPHLTYFPIASELLRLSSRFELLSGQADTALDDCTVALRLADSLRDEPVLVSLLTRGRLHRVATREAARILDRSEPSERALLALLTALGDTADRSHFVRALEGERCFGLAVFSDIFGSRLSARNLHDMGLDSPLLLTRTGVFVFRPLLMLDAVNYIEILNSFSDCSRRPWYLCSVQWQTVSRTSLADIGRYRLAHPVLSLMLPAISRAGTGFDWYLAVRSAAAQAVALRLYRIRNGHYPDGLSDLVPDFLAKLPPDPFSGTDFVYRKEGTGFVLYSLGANLTDEGGTAGDADHDRGDVVWQCSR